VSKIIELPDRLLLGPGPSNTPESVLKAMSQPTIGHLDPVFIEIMDDIKMMLQQTLQTNQPLTMPVSAPGSAGMEACFVNLVEPGDQVIVAVNGVFGLRMVENVKRTGATPVIAEFNWGEPVQPEQIEALIKSHPKAKVLAFVHAETSTGAMSDAASLCKLAKKYGLLSIVDTVTSWCGIEVDVDGWAADAVYSGTQKCLSAVPGISPVSFSEAAMDCMANRKLPVQSWFLDMNLIMKYWQEGAKRVYHHTAPVNTLYAIHEALRLVVEEGLETRWQRHWDAHKLLADGLADLGLELLVAKDARLPMLNAVKIPDDIDDGQVRSRLLNNYDIEIGAGLGPLSGKIWRIGLMGNNASATVVEKLLSAMQVVLGEQRTGNKASLSG
jgi:alanine-glyoxylate transaminase / serine-glyoxylate transaminase / serine-pyruvate transaminase